MTRTGGVPAPIIFMVSISSITLIGGRRMRPGKVYADFREPLTLLISAHFRALSAPTFGVIVELRCINAGTNKSIHGGS